MRDFFEALLPWANWWNAIILTLDIILAICFVTRYHKTKSRALLNSMPGILTSLGLLGTFGAICSSLAGISVAPVEEAERFGKSIAELGVSSGDLDLKRIISDLIPAFSTSIYGLVGAIIFTVYTKLLYAKEDAELESSLQFKEPDLALEAIYTKLEEQIKTNNENSEILNSSIEAQSEILAKFVDGFIGKMNETFEAMNTVIQQRVTDYGDTQFDQSRRILEGITTRLSEEAQGMIQDHNERIRTLTEATLEYQRTQEEKLRLHSEESLEQMRTFSDQSIALQEKNIERELKIHSDLVDGVSSRLRQSLDEMIQGVRQECSVLASAISQNVEALRNSYTFIDEKSSSIIANYEQAAESYREAVQQSHDLCERTDKSLDAIDKSLKSVEKTNENVGRIAKVVEDKEQTMEAIVMRIEELGQALVTLQKLESAIAKLSAK